MLMKQPLKVYYNLSILHSLIAKLILKFSKSFIRYSVKSTEKNTLNI
jgi:hypothetical protein